VEIPDIELKQLNVKTTFLYGRLKEDILMQLPKGFELWKEREILFVD